MKLRISLIILLGILIWIIICIKKRKERRYYSPPRKEKNWKRSLKSILIILGCLILVGGILVGGFYGYKYLLNNLGEILQSPANVSVEQVPQQIFVGYSLWQDGLFRGIVLTAFIVLMIIILFRCLNIRANIRIGNDFDVRRNYEDRKASRLQKKINQEILKQELKRAKVGHSN